MIETRRQCSAGPVRAGAKHPTQLEASQGGLAPFGWTAAQKPRSSTPLTLLLLPFWFPDVLTSSLWSPSANSFMSFGSCSSCSLHVEHPALLTF